MILPAPTWRKLLLIFTISLVQACLLIWLILERTEIPVIKETEVQLFKAIDFLDNFFAHKKSEQPYIFIDVSYDQTVQTDTDGKRIIETDYVRLSELLSVFNQKRDSIQFIYCDLFTEESFSLSEPLKLAVTGLKNKILFASRTDPKNREGLSIKHTWLPRASAMYNQLNGYLISYPLVLTNFTGKLSATTPLQLYIKNNNDKHLTIAPKMFFPSLFVLGGESHFRSPIINFHLRNDDLVGQNESSLYPKYSLFQLVKHCHDKNFFNSYNLLNKIIIIGNLNKESLEDKHLTSAEENTYGSLVIVNAWEMLRLGETRIKTAWLLMMVFSLFIASFKSVLMTGYGYNIYYRRKFSKFLLKWRLNLNKRSGRKRSLFGIKWIQSLGRGILKYLRILEKNTKLFRKQLTGFINHWIIQVILGSETRKQIQSLFNYLINELLSWFGFSVILCLISYFLFGIKFEFLLLTLFFATEEGFLNRLNIFIRNREKKFRKFPKTK